MPLKFDNQNLVPGICMQDGRNWLSHIVFWLPHLSYGMPALPHHQAYTHIIKIYKGIRRYVIKFVETKMWLFVRHCTQNRSLDFIHLQSTTCYTFLVSFYACNQVVFSSTLPTVLCLLQKSLAVQLNFFPVFRYFRNSRSFKIFSPVINKKLNTLKQCILDSSLAYVYFLVCFLKCM